jgi:uncharacterized protein YvpB
MQKKIIKILPFTIFMALFVGCGERSSVFTSDCNDDFTHSYKRVAFSELVNHLKKYDKQYVEVTGKYVEAPEQSALFNDSLFADHSIKQAIWIDLFQYNNGQFTQINNKHVIIRGRVDAHDKGHLNQYNGAIERISYINL